MLRHVISAARAFAQIPHGIIRSPRLTSDAKNLLIWQLSLHPDDRECLSDTARKAGIPKTAFQRAKRTLLAEGYLHEWRMQAAQGRFTTVQLVSNVVLTPEEAAAVRDGRRRAPGASRLVAPSAAEPAVGGPNDRAVGGQPKKNTRENTHRPTAPARPPVPARRPEAPEAPQAVQPAVTAPAPPEDGAAEELLRSLARTQPRLAMSARTVRRWAPLLEPWLAGGLSSARIREALTQGLSDARSPLGVLRWRLEHARPELPPPPPPVEHVPPRVTAMRECEGTHTQPLLFRPVDGETRCPACRSGGDAPRPVGSGFAAFLAARAPRAVGPRPV
ncbi:hypothetical protein [Streptomyces sp. TR02-1]|uniref:hypothetical protein n=1 Tax=Streptomyces sp. TR02-1 TaxID=3385977 RepID=UPI00399F8285